MWGAFGDIINWSEFPHHSSSDSASRKGPDCIMTRFTTGFSAHKKSAGPDVSIVNIPPELVTVIEMTYFTKDQTSNKNHNCSPPLSVISKRRGRPSPAYDIFNVTKFGDALKIFKQSNRIERLIPNCCDVVASNSVNNSRFKYTCA
jgi:hypothetical protein